MGRRLPTAFFSRDSTMSKQTPRRALIVIGVQNEYVTGKFRIEYPPVASLLRNIAKAIDAVRANGVPLVLVQHVLPPMHRYSQKVAWAQNFILTLQTALMTPSLLKLC